MDTLRKFNVVDLYFDLAGELEEKSTKKLYPQGNYQTVLYANFRAADPTNVMGVYFELANGQTLDEQPMYYVGIVKNDGVSYQRWEFILPNEVVSSYRKDREVQLLIQFSEREIADFIGVYDAQSDLPTNVDSGSYAWVIEDEAVFLYSENQAGTLQWTQENELQTYNQIWGSDLVNIPVSRALRVTRDTVDVDTSDLVLKALAKTQGDKLNKTGDNADADISINGVTFNYLRDTDAILGSEYDTRVNNVDTAINARVKKAGDNMTGDLDMGNNNISIGGQVNHTTFNNGELNTDAVKFTDLANIFDVSLGTGDPNYQTTLKTTVEDKFDEYVKQSDLDEDYLRRDGANSMKVNLDVGGNDIDNVNLVDGVDVSQLKTDFDNHDHTEADIVDLDKYSTGDVDTLLSGKADLDSHGKVLLNQLPDITKQPTLVFATTQAFNEADTSELIAGTKAFDVEARNGYVWDGTQWQLTSDADWENINLEWSNVLNTPTDIDGYGITDAYDKDEVDGLLDTKSDVGHTHVENDITDLDKYTQQEVDDALDLKENAANIGNRTYTEENIITNEDTVTKSLDDLDIEVNRLENDKEDSVNIGNRQYTEENIVTNNETITASIDALDIKVKDLDDTKMELDGSNSNVENLKFQNQDTEDPLDVGEIRLNNNLPEWQVSANTLHLVGRQLIERAINRTGATLTVGKPLFISGVFTPGQGPGTDRIEVELATRSNANGVFAVASCPAPGNEEGCIITRGSVHGWDTSAYQAGDKLYLTDQAGVYNVGPVDDGEAEFFVGKVIRAAQDGIVLINPTRISDALFVRQDQLTTEIPILDAEGLILPQFLGDRYSDVFKGYGVFDTTDPEFPVLLDFYLVDQWDVEENEPIDPEVKAPYRAGTIYVTLNVTIDTMYRYDETSESFVGLAPSPVGLGNTAGTAYPGNEGQANRDDIDLILSDYATDTNLNAHVVDTNNPHAVTAAQTGALSDTHPAKDVTAQSISEWDDAYTHSEITAGNPHGVTKGEVGLSLVQNYPISTKEQAETGTNDESYMTPLRVNQAIQELAPAPDLSPYALDQDLQNHVGATNNPHSVTKTQVGLGNVDNVQQIPLTQKGAANGVASLDANSKVPLNQLPDTAKQQTYVVATFANLPTTNVLSGDKGYVTGTGDSYIWNGSSWLTLAEADWENVNLDYGNITNPPTIGNGTLTVQGSSGLTGNGTFTADQATNATITLSHANTSSQGNISTTGAVIVSGVTLDTYGHVTGLSTREIEGDDLYNVVSGGFANIRDDTPITIWVGTQAQYDAIGTKDPNRLYFIQES